MAAVARVGASSPRPPGGMPCRIRACRVSYYDNHTTIIIIINIIIIIVVIRVIINIILIY